MTRPTVLGTWALVCHSILLMYSKFIPISLIYPQILTTNPAGVQARDAMVLLEVYEVKVEVFVVVFQYRPNLGILLPGCSIPDSISSSWSFSSDFLKNKTNESF